jgi:hypothetical protein
MRNKDDEMVMKGGGGENKDEWEQRKWYVCGGGLGSKTIEQPTKQLGDLDLSACVMDWYQWRLLLELYVVMIDWWKKEDKKSWLWLSVWKKKLFLGGRKGGLYRGGEGVGDYEFSEVGGVLLPSEDRK